MGSVGAIGTSLNHPACCDADAEKLRSEDWSALPLIVFSIA